MLLRYLMRGEADPWMFHQANLRAYDGQHSLLGDLIDAALVKLTARLSVPVRTPRMIDNGARFARRVNLEGAGVRATLVRGRALVIDAGRAVSIPVTGVRAADGEAHGGDVIGMVDVGAGSACIPLDAAGAGCSPAPVREGGAGPVTALPRAFCDGTGTAGLPPGATVTAIARRATWKYRDRGEDLGTAWRARTYDDAGWASGAGPLGYGESYLGTTVSYGPSSSSKYITTYVRKQFVVDDPQTVTGMRGELMFDDGVVVYLNGAEIGRASMPSGTVTAATFANGAEANNSYTSYDWDAHVGRLVAGTNTIAVEVHQSSASSSDLVVDLALILEVTEAPPPPPPPPPPPSPPPPPGDVVVARNAAWWFWDNGGDLGTAWRTQTSGGTGWESGRGVFGYGETYIDTPVSYGSSSSTKHITTYFTTTFSVADAAAVTSMAAEVMYHHGFVAYLNGIEVGRAAMPAGAIGATTRALGHEAADAYETFDWTAVRGALRSGTNVLAVEVHQADATSSDLVFDLALRIGGGGTPPPPPPPPPAGEDIPRGSTWRYWDRAAAPSAADEWATGSFDDAAWSSGVAPLGYGESYLATQVSFGADPANKPVTVYFRHWFRVDDPAAVTRLLGEVLYDDGAVIHLNGHEIGRLAMPAGSIGHTTVSPGHETGRYKPFDWSAFRSRLVPGNNLIAVEVHQAASSSSDLAFDLALTVE